MLYNFIISGIAMLLAVTAWFMLFTLATSKNKAQIGLIALIIVALLLPKFFKYSYYICGLTSKLIFQRHANGEVQLNYSSLRIPDDAPQDYCKQFTDEDGNQITTKIYWTDGKAYCGYFWGLSNETVVFLPFRVLPNNKVEYWADPNLKIIGTIAIKDKALLWQK